MDCPSNSFVSFVAFLFACFLFLLSTSLSLLCFQLDVCKSMSLNVRRRARRRWRRIRVVQLPGPSAASTDQSTKAAERHAKMISALQRLKNNPDAAALAIDAIVREQTETIETTDDTADTRTSSASVRARRAAQGAQTIQISTTELPGNAELEAKRRRLKEREMVLFFVLF